VAVGHLAAGRGGRGAELGQRRQRRQAALPPEPHSELLHPLHVHCKKNGVIFHYGTRQDMRTRSIKDYAEITRQLNIQKPVFWIYDILVRIQDPGIRTIDLKVRIRLFSSVAFKMPTKNKFFF
jgi:hypothetical protein